MRIKGGLAIIVLALLGLYATTQIFGHANDVTGVVFHDYNGNGKRDNYLGTNPGQAADRGLTGITVKGFGSDNVLCDTRTTDANGAYTLQMGNCVGTKYRVEFSGLPAGYNPSQIGPDSKTTTQFVVPGSIANLGAYRSSDYCQNNPKLVTSCIRAGAYNDQDAEANENTILAFLYGSSGTTNPPISLGRYGQVGTSYAQMYRPSNQSVYSAAYMRRHDGFGPGGPGAVYVSRMPASTTGTATPSLAFTIPNAGGDSHPTANNNCSSRDGQSSSSRTECWAHDQFSFDTPGKRSLGAMALTGDGTPANDALLVTNLNDRKLYKVTNLDGTPTPTGYDLPLSLPNSGDSSLPSGAAAGQHRACVTDDVRPFAVNVYNGVGYIGMVCSAQSTRSTSDLRAYVYSFNPSTMAFASAPTIELPLNYDRSCAYGNNGSCAARATWNPWISQFTDPLVKDAGTLSGSTTHRMAAPQPMLVDIGFSDNGSMTLGFRDRYDDQMGYEAKSTSPSNSQRYTAMPAGDLLRACLVNNSYVLESSGKCGSATGGGSHALANGLPQGIGGSEFYSNEYFANTNGSVLNTDENSRGALAQVPGYDSFASTATSPLDGNSLGFDTGGIRTYSSNDGSRTNSYRIYKNEPGDSFLKGNGLGDVAYICDAAPIEIGNRVWKDSNGNGVQDATEPGIPNVTVSLKNAGGTVIATALTSSDGSYLFSSRTLDENGQPVTSSSSAKYGVTALSANTSFKLSLSTAADYSDPSRLQGLHLTTANTTANYGNDQNDSDATPVDPNNKLSATNPATISLTTGGPGANNHDFDFGFNQTVSVGNFVWIDSNKNGVVDGSEFSQGVNGVKVRIYAASADTNNDGKLSAAELAAATAIAEQTTANDTRPGSTKGRPGYYLFEGLSPGNYFVAVAASNFGNGQPLEQLTEVPVPSGVGDTQDDNNNHGAVPNGGNLAASGVVSTRINLQPGEEPTSASEKPDDDANVDSDTTIDFGFWHAYSLGNRVWQDKNNSATIDAADGQNPGIAGVGVRLLSSNGTTEVANTHTDSNGYYRFDNLNAGTYIVEIAASNFGNNGALHKYNLSSIGAGEETDPDLNVDNNDNGINPTDVGKAVRSGTVTLGPGASEPLNEKDLGPGGQGTTDSFANMTVDFGFLDTTSMGDTVYYDLDGDGTQDPGEPGIPNVTVTMVCDNKAPQTQKTDANGNYLFINILPGTCTATVTQSDVPGAVITTPGDYSNTFVDDTSYLDADFGFRANGSIGNQVWKEVFNNGTYSPAEGDMPVSGVKVELYRDLNGNGQVDDSDIIMGTRTTDDNGHYQFTNLPTEDNILANGSGAQYVIRLVDPDNKLKDLQASVGPNPGQDNNSQTPNGYGMVLTPAAPSNQTGDFGYHGSATVGDTVYYDADNSGTQGPTETLLPGITVTLTYPGPDKDCSTANDNVTKSMVTDANGNYLFTNLLGGDYCISIQPPAGTTITTNNQGQKFTLGPTQVDLTRDFGVIGDGKIGNQVFIDGNTNGRYDTGDTPVAGVTLDLYRDDNRNGKADAGEPVIKTATTGTDGQYMFQNLVTGDVNATGVAYVVVVTDTANKLAGLIHVMGNGSADNESKDPTGYAIVLTPTDNTRLEADFGYKSNPDVVIPPKFWKKQVVDGTSLKYTLTWINQSATNNIATNFYDVIPDGTTYVEGSLKCQAKGSSTTDNCKYNAELKRIEWSGKVGADLGHSTPDVAVNPIVVDFAVKLDTTTLEVYNQGFGTYGDGQTTVPSDWIDTPIPNDPTYYVRTPENAAVQKITGGVLANTGQLIVAAAILAGAIIVFSSAYVLWSRRTINFK